MKQPLEYMKLSRFLFLALIMFHGGPKASGADLESWKTYMRITNSGSGTFTKPNNIVYYDGTLFEPAEIPAYPNSWSQFSGYSLQSGYYYGFSGSGGLYRYPNIYLKGEWGFEVEKRLVYSTSVGPGTMAVYDVNAPPDERDNGKNCDSCSDCRGMAVWSVSEPYVSLWIRDEPLGYQPVKGKRIAFELSFKQREYLIGMDAYTFSAGKRWNLSWLSYVSRPSDVNVVRFADGRTIPFPSEMDSISNTKLTGNTTSGFTLTYPNGSKDIYGFVVTNSSGGFHRAYMSAQSNAEGQTTTFAYDPYVAVHYQSMPVIRLKEVTDAEGGVNRLYYSLTNHPFSTNLISHVVDRFSRTNFLEYDASGRLTNIVDVVGIRSSFKYDSEDRVSELVTPNATNTFQITDNAGTNFLNYRSVLVTQPDGGRHLYLFRANATATIPSSYAGSEVPSVSPFSQTFENSNLNQRNSFYWGPRQYGQLSTTNIANFTATDYAHARMKHWLAGSDVPVGSTISLERQPSPDGSIEGQKTWYDYEGKTSNGKEGTKLEPLFVAQVLPNGTTRFTRSIRNSYSAVTNEISTYSIAAAGPVLLRTNIYVYDAAGIDLLAFTNAAGVLVSSNVYNANHQILTNFNALGERTVYTYDAGGRLSSSLSPSGLLTTNIYGGDGFLAQQIVIGYSTNSYTYVNGLVATHTDARGLTISNTWDNLQRLRRVDYPDGTFVTNSYNALDLIQTVDRMGHTNSFGYDSMRRKVVETNALGRYTFYNYCNCGSLDSITDPAGNPTTFHYDNAGRLLATIYPDGYCVTNRLNLIGQVTSRLDSTGMSMTNWFNNQGLQVAVSNAFGRVQTVVFDALDRATNNVDANGVSINTTYDLLDRVRTRSYPDGGTEAFGYTLNVPGLTSYTNQLNQVTRYGYDSAGRKVAETNANLEITKFGYSGPGDLLTLTDGKNQVTSWAYDVFGRVTNKVDAASNLLFVYRYDPDNRLTNRWSAAKGSTVYRYDPLGNLTNIVYPVSPSISLAYDVLNRLTNMVDAVGTTKYNYDAAGQVLSEDGPWSDDTVNFAYQNRLRTGLNLRAPNGSPWTQSYGYDVMKRLTNVTSQAGSFGYAYRSSQASSLVSQLSLPGGAYITNTYDLEGRLLSTVLKNSANTILNSHSYQLNLGSQRTQQVFTAGNTMDYTYDNIGQLKMAKGKEAGGTTNRLHEQFGYTHDAAGNLNVRTNNALVQNFGVNNLNELTAITRSGTLTVAGTTTSQATNVTVNSLMAQLYGDFTFAKDGFTLVNGNNTFTAVAQDSYGRADTNAITVNLPATNSFAYDLNGNMLTNGTRFFEYDDENQLIRITEPGAWKSEFVYDGKMRRRIEKNFTWSGSSWTQTNELRFVYDGNVVLQERDGNNIPQVTLTRGLDLSGSFQGAGGIGGLLARSEMSDLQSPQAYYHADGNGNITALINTNQFIVARFGYDPFGNTLSITGPKAFVNRYRFSSKPIHELSGMYDYLYRWYMPELQRWLNRDPIAETGGVNLFAFVKSAPNGVVDPFGLVGVEDRWTPCCRGIKLSYDLSGDTDWKNKIHVRPFVSKKTDSLDEAVEHAQKRLPNYDPDPEKCRCIIDLVIIGHGGEGSATGQISFPNEEDNIYIKILGKTEAEKQKTFNEQQGVKKLQKLAALMCTGGEIRFTACYANDQDGDMKRQLEAALGGVHVNLQRGIGFVYFGAAF